MNTPPPVSPSDIGISANTVAAAVMRIGRRRRRVPCSTASSRVAPASRSRFTRSISTMAFVTTMPMSMSRPIRAGSPRAVCVTSRPMMAPVAANGMEMSSTSGPRKLRKVATITSSTSMIAASIARPSCPNASSCCSAAPPCSNCTPAGSFVSAMAVSIERLAVASSPSRGITVSDTWRSPSARVIVGAVSSCSIVATAERGMASPVTSAASRCSASAASASACRVAASVCAWRSAAICSSIPVMPACALSSAPCRPASCSARSSWARTSASSSGVRGASGTTGAAESCASCSFSAPICDTSSARWFAASAIWASSSFAASMRAASASALALSSSTLPAAFCASAVCCAVTGSSTSPSWSAARSVPGVRTMMSRSWPPSMRVPTVEPERASCTAVAMVVRSKPRRVASSSSTTTRSTGCSPESSLVTERTPSASASCASSRSLASRSACPSLPEICSAMPSPAAPATNASCEASEISPASGSASTASWTAASTVSTSAPSSSCRS